MYYLYNNLLNWHKNFSPAFSFTIIFFLTLLSLFTYNIFSYTEKNSIANIVSSKEIQPKKVANYILPDVGAFIKVPFPRFNPFSYEVSVLDEKITLSPHQNFSSMLKIYGVPDDDIKSLIKSLPKKIKLNKLRVGTDFDVKITRNNNHDISSLDEFAHHLSEVKFKPYAGVSIEAIRDEDGSYKVNEILSKIEMKPIFRSGSIRSSLYKNAIDVGVPPKMIAQSIKKFSNTVDFRTLSKGDRFEYSFKEFFDDNSKRVGFGHLEYASLTVDGKKHEIYYIIDNDGSGDWYNAKGRKNRTLLMRTPIDGARISSRYGMRRHPVLGYSKMHKGIDFAAPTGTPIYASGDGVVVKKYRSSTYGNYIKIKHTGTYETAYAHLSRFKVGIREGKSVKQGQIIGYVGSTGRSTGPHLHYEVIKNGKQINPLSGKLPTSSPVSDKQKNMFKNLKKEITLRRDNKSRIVNYKNIYEVKDYLI